MTTLARRATDTIARFGRDRSGSIAMMTGLIFPVLVIAAGGVADITRAHTVQTKSQKTLDAAVLSMARSTLTDNEIARNGPEIFESWMTDRKVAGDVTVSQFSARNSGGTVPGQAGTVTGSATLTTKNYFLGIFGRETLEIEISSTSLKPNPLPYEISLVLDVSGSMNESLNGRPRIDRLKVSVAAMLDEIERQSAGREAPAISVVPFSTSVNLGDLDTGILQGASIRGAALPLSGTDIWAAERMRGDNGTSYDLSDEAPAISPVPFVTASEMPSSSRQPRVRLRAPTTNPAQYRRTISRLKAEGGTAGHLGMIWGTYALSPAWSSVWSIDPRPYGEARKVIVMLTDGELNTTLNIGARSTRDVAGSNRYFRSACNLAKAKGITIYTIALNLDAASEAGLRACSKGSGGQMFSADSADALTEAFKEIAEDLGKLHLSS